MAVITGLSGNEIFCLAQKGYNPGNIVVGNSVHSLGILGGLGSGIKAMIGGEISQITSLIEDGRATAYERMLNEAVNHRASGITGVTSELIFHAGNIEFLSIGSTVHAEGFASGTPFSTSADGQELFAQLDAGYQPIAFAFGNVAYSMGLGRGLMGGLKTLVRGEIKEYSNMFNHTRHLALARIIDHARNHDANAVLGIQTTILPFGGVNEMLMIGTAARGRDLGLSEKIISSDMTNVEMWNLVNAGFAPIKLLLGTSVYSLGVVGGVGAILKGFVRGEINQLTRLIYDARENALAIIENEAKQLGADDVIGVKTYVYQIGGGLVEFLAIGTAVKKIPNMKTASNQLPPQAIVVDRSTFYDASNRFFNVNVGTGVKPMNRSSLLVALIFFVIAVYSVFHQFLHNLS